MPEATAPSASTDATAPKATAPAVEDATVFIDSGLYNPKAEHTVSSWLEVKALLPCTYSALEEAGKNHKNQGFLPYLKQRKAIVPEGTDLADLRPARKTKVAVELGPKEEAAPAVAEAPKGKK